MSSSGKLKSGPVSSLWKDNVIVNIGLFFKIDDNVSMFERAHQRT